MTNKVQARSSAPRTCRSRSRLRRWWRWTSLQGIMGPRSTRKTAGEKRHCGERAGRTGRSRRNFTTCGHQLLIAFDSLSGSCSAGGPGPDWSAIRCAAPRRAGHRRDALSNIRRRSRCAGAQKRRRNESSSPSKRKRWTTPTPSSSNANGSCRWIKDRAPLVDVVLVPVVMIPSWRSSRSRR